jgi:hypothetical protein
MYVLLDTTASVHGPFLVESGTLPCGLGCAYSPTGHGGRGVENQQPEFRAGCPIVPQRCNPTGPDLIAGLVKTQALLES